MHLAWLAGDLFEMSLPEAAFDRVLVPNLLHLFAPDRNVRLLRVAARALRTGGELAVIDVAREVDGEDRSLALYDLTLSSRTVDGRVYSEAEIGVWLREVGLRPEPVEPLGDTGMDLIRAR